MSNPASPGAVAEGIFQAYFSDQRQGVGLAGNCLPWYSKYLFFKPIEIFSELT